MPSGIIVPGEFDGAEFSVRLPNGGWRPRWYQGPLWEYLENGGLRAVAVWHRRAGKDETVLHRTCIAAHERVAGYWHMLPLANQARKAIWTSVNPRTGRRRIDEAFPIELRKKTVDNEMFIEFLNGSTWQVVGSDNYESLIGSNVAGLVFSEYAQSDPRAWGFLRPILEENGGWAIFIYTPRGNNHGLEMYNHALKNIHDPIMPWFAQRLSIEDTGIFTEKQKQDALREYRGLFGPATGDAYYKQEYLVSFDAAIIGAYYWQQLEDIEHQNRICSVPHQKGFVVNTAWDLGISDHTCIWFYQQIGSEIHVIDYYTNAGVGLEHYAQMLRQKAQSLHYVYGEHLWPHDGGAKELGTGRTRQETMQGFGVGNIRIIPMSRVEDGINASRRILDRCFFDEKRTEPGIKALKWYRREWDEVRKTFLDKPVHDWASHGADGFRTLSMGMIDGLALPAPTMVGWPKKPDRSRCFV